MDEFDDLDTAALQRDIAKIKRAWLNEKNSPELLTYEAAAVESLLEALAEQEKAAREHAHESETNMFLSNVYDMELSRLKYLVSAYIRTRLWKLEKHFMFYLSREDTRGRLSQRELDFAYGYKELFEKHMNAACLSELPDSLKSLSEKKPGLNMVPEPDTGVHVFCQVHDSIGPVQLRTGGESVRMDTDDIFILQYAPIMVLVRSGRVSLI
eukprot:m.151149 g.151149  ORF g.151149 m.151149 type:complete len:211 (+) comp16895_c0_seq2:57-689(+)